MKSSASPMVCHAVIALMPDGLRIGMQAEGQAVCTGSSASRMLTRGSSWRWRKLQIMELKWWQW
jgi:hypothetical protein